MPELVLQLTRAGFLLLLWAGFMVWIADRKKSEVLALVRSDDGQLRAGAGAEGVVLAAAMDTDEFLDAVDTKDVVRYEAAMLSYLRSDKPEILTKIRDTKSLDDDTAAALKDALTAFGKQFA